MQQTSKLVAWTTLSHTAKSQQIKDHSWICFCWNYDDLAINRNAHVPI